MRLGARLGGSVAILASVLAAGIASANGPEVGANVGVAVPTGDYSKTANVGGTIGLWGGYRFSLTKGVSLSLVGNPQFTLLPTKGKLNDLPGSSSLTSMAILGAGPVLTLGEGPWLGSVGAQGAYYRDMSGPLNENGAGWNIFGTVGYEVIPNGTLGVFARYDQANLLPSIESNPTATRRLFLGGLGFDYVFAAPPPPPPAPPPPPPPPTPVAKRKIVLRGVNFDFNKSNIRPDARPILNEAVATLKAEPQIRVSVDGYTDAIGSVPYNLKLSQRRADSVVKYLEDGGIAANRLKPVGHGKSDPVASNDTAEGRAQNRRVELNVISGD